MKMTRVPKYVVRDTDYTIDDPTPTATSVLDLVALTGALCRDKNEKDYTQHFDTDEGRHVLIRAKPSPGRGAHTTTHPPDARGATHMAYESHHM